MIPSAFIEEVKKLLDPVALVGSRVKLVRSGNGYSGSCPFHDERQASFRLYPKDRRFFCFGCGASGDVFQFFQRADRKAFPEVVRELAASVGIAVPRDRDLSPEEERKRDEKKALLAACEIAACHFERNLWGSEGGEEARRYLAQRGVSEETARSFRLGYARADWHDLERALTSARVAGTIQEAAGLVAPRRDAKAGRRRHDRFRKRLVFPVRDARGRVIGFGGRAIHDDEPKYLNSPETGLYKKSRTLYGLHEAREAIRRTGRAIVVEGYFDVLALQEVGLGEVVSAGGTALRSVQIALLEASGAFEVVLLFDGDEAGSLGTLRAAATLLRGGVSVRVGRIPPSVRDPDVLAARSGRTGVEEVLAAARPLTEFLVEEAMERHASGAGAHAAVEHKLAVIRALTPFVLATRGLARSTFERSLAHRLGIDIGPLRAEYRRAASRGEVRTP